MSRADDAARGRVLAWLHIGDPHLATAEADNHRDPRRIVALANALPFGSNELANGGGTVFMATRSTGRVEEGPPGFSIAAVDGDRVGPWPEKGILDTRLGPNRNGRQW